MQVSTNRNTNKVKGMVLLSMFSAIVVVLGFTIGFIPIPLINATLMHIPVIVGACLLGPVKGGILGFEFGLMSFIRHSYIAPTITSFVFTPFYPGGNFLSLVICFVPRILIGVSAYYCFKALSNTKKLKNTAGIAAGLCGSLTNTILVMSMIGLFFGSAYSEIRNIPMMEIIITVVTTNGVIEAVVAAVLTPLIVWPLKKIYK